MKILIFMICLGWGLRSLFISGFKKSTAFFCSKNCYWIINGEEIEKNLEKYYKQSLKKVSKHKPFVQTLYEQSKDYFLGEGGV